MEDSSDNVSYWEIQVDCLSQVNFALQQSSIPFIRNIEVTNHSNEVFTNIDLKISSQPDFIAPSIQKIDRIDANQSVLINPSNVKLNFDFFSNLSESVNASLCIELFQSDKDNSITILTEKNIDITALAANSWLGLNFMPQFLAAFVTPNLDSIAHIQKQMSELLEKSNLDGALSGYQSDKAHVKDMLQAAYHVIALQKIDYAVSPSSFDGQRIRFVPEILKLKLANCLDITLLFASVFEQCGLNPLILLKESHAFVGCHATDNTFSEPFIDDATRIKNRVEVDDIFIFEATCALGDKPSDFQYAESTALNHLTDADFEGVLDIKQCRAEKFLPLPLQMSEDSEDHNIKYGFVKNESTFDPQIKKYRDVTDIGKVSTEKQSPDRLRGWQEKLLDTSKKNRLINFRDNGKCVPLEISDICKLEDYLSADRVISILPTNPIIDGADERDQETLGYTIQQSPLEAYLNNELENSRIHSSYDKKKLDSKLLSIYRQAKSDLDNGGFNTLYMALGLLEWCKEEDLNKKHCLAPILLIPMTLTRRSAKDGFSLSRADEEIIVNVSLLEMLIRDFKMTIPGLDANELPKDSSGVDVGKILLLFQDAIKDVSGWDVHRKAWLGCFSFQKILMYNDLKNCTEDLLKNPLVDHLINHPNESYDDKIAMIEPEVIDQDITSDTLYCPLSADSSQLCAVLSAERGKSFVLYGPPGTGKSQTITNIIAHCLASDKKVLFVSEKRAALEVVYRRLQDVGLGPFCLELHSNKSGKNEVMQQFREVLSYENRDSRNSWEQVTRELDKLRVSLRDYVKELHKIYPNGFTLYRAFSFLIAHENLRDKIVDLKFNVAKLSEPQIAEIRSCAENLQIDSEKFDSEDWRLLSSIDKSTWSNPWSEQVQKISTEYLDSIAKFMNCVDSLREEINFVSDKISSEFHNLVILSNYLGKSVVLPQGLYSDDWETVSDELEKFDYDILERYQLLLKLKKSGFDKFINPDFLNFNSEPCFYFSNDTINLPRFADSASWQNSLPDLIRHHISITQELKLAVKEGCIALGVIFEEFNSYTVADLLSLWELICNSTMLLETLLRESGKENIATGLRIANSGIELEKLGKLLSNFDLEKVRSCNITKLKEKFNHCKDQSNVFKKISIYFVLKKLNSFLLDKSIPVELESAGDLLDEFVVYVESYKAIRNIPIQLAQKLDELWNFEKTDWGELKNTLETTQKIDSAIDSLIAIDSQVDEELRKIVCNRVIELTGSNREKYHEQREICYGNLKSTYEKFKVSWSAIIHLFQENFNTPNISGKLSELMATLQDTSLETDASIDHSCFIENIANFVNKSLEIDLIAPKLDLNNRACKLWNEGCWNHSAWVNCHNTIINIESIINTEEFAENISEIRTKLGQILSNPISQATLAKKCNELCHAWENYTQINQRASDIVSADLQAENISFNQELFQYIHEHGDVLRRWCRWCDTRKKAFNLQLEEIVSQTQNSEKNISATLAVDLALYSKFVDEVSADSEIIGRFLGDDQNQKIKKFKELDELYTKLAAQKVISKVADTIPSRRARMLDSNSGLGEFKREVQRQNRIIPVRKLLSKYSDISLRLKPCMLMSPLSVAQYLPPGQSNFDLVIFDEASQITPWDAIGVIARGKQLIVVGDPKQLPPTSFFQRQEDDDDSYEDDQIVDEKSILDECLAANMCTLELKWHYRSRHEDLIAFSNFHYYANSLFTFPAAQFKSDDVANKLIDLGVHFHYVDNGVYTNRTNPIEAKIVVENVVRTLKTSYFMDGLKRGKKKSLGIITFNQAQQEIIEDLLDEARRQNPEIEPFFQAEYLEPVFVKNIENVQGDERDFIFFSICYGYKEGKQRISMNFGPLNNEGGERRLNVAITRAKESIFVFSSIRHDDIDLSRTNKLGPAHLKYFLEYAEKGSEVLGKSISSYSRNDFESVFEEEVASFLRLRGYDVRTQIGASGYRIDLGIVSPNHPGRFVLGIECDGASYHSGATVRDRDKLRQQVLEGLGWKIIRVWSTDWWYSAHETKENLIHAVDDAIEKENDLVCSTDQDEVNPPIIDSVTLTEPQVNTQNVESSKENFPASILDSCPFAQLYPSLDYLSTLEVFNNLDTETFYEPSTSPLLKMQIREILVREAPITDALLTKRIARVWGFQRTGEKITNIISSLIQAPSNYSLKDKVYWQNIDDERKYRKFRINSGNTDSDRKLEEIPLEEIVNAMIFCFEEYESFPDESSLFKEAGHCFGFNRLTQVAQIRYQAALQKLKASGYQCSIG